MSTKLDQEVRGRGNRTRYGRVLGVVGREGEGFWGKYKQLNQFYLPMWRGEEATWFHEFPRVPDASLSNPKTRHASNKCF